MTSPSSNPPPQLSSTTFLTGRKGWKNTVTMRKDRAWTLFYVSILFVIVGYSFSDLFDLYGYVPAVVFFLGSMTLFIHEKRTRPEVRRAISLRRLRRRKARA